jgi:hypothetical protein
LYGSGERGWLGRQVARLPDAFTRPAVRLALGLGVVRRRLVFGAIFGMRDTGPRREAERAEAQVA